MPVSLALQSRIGPDIAKARPVTAIAFPPLNATAKAEAIANVNATMEPLRELAPDMGAYINEVGCDLKPGHENFEGNIG